jgi:2-polyprenyl-3-methyl-5-hydroxy-6-metoxy-1,4-benzoquinol methylase
LDASVIDMGGGASTLVDDLLSQGFLQVPVLDLSASALELARNRIGATGNSVTWMAGDIREVELPERTTARRVWPLV